MIGAKCDLKDRFARRFLTLDEEQLIFSTRQHWSILIPVFSINIFLILLVAVLTAFSTFMLPIYFFTFLILGIIILTISLEILIKLLVEWFFHFYIVTNRKIVEVAYRPMFSKIIHEVLLDQVRCTEVDVKANGLSNEIFNVGTVLITFDRPTNEKIFTLEFIKEPRKVAMHLGDAFGMQKNNEEPGLWVSNPMINSAF